LGLSWIRLLIDFIAIFTILFNSFLETYNFSDIFKQSKMICLSKITSYPSIAELSPISWLYILRKLFKRVISRKRKLWMHDSAINPNEQSGFPPKLGLATRFLTLTEAYRASISDTHTLKIFVWGVNLAIIITISSLLEDH
jgi:hypothetical protein